MDRNEVVNLLKNGRAGVKQWNGWRQKSVPAGQPFDLSWANLLNANLTEADLTGTILDDANLAFTDLIWSKVRFARLNRANLHGTKLYAADFTESDLSGAILTQADLSAATLEGTNFTGAVSNSTLWVNVDLSKAKGLEAVRHEGPSTVGLDTLIKSKGEIPEAFLRGCGVPQNLIDYLPSLIGSMQPIQFHSCFISHSSEDKEFCRRLHARMQQENLRVWLDEKEMAGGRKLHEQIGQAIQSHDKLLLVLSEHSMSSKWVKTEIIMARKREISENREILFPICLCSFDAVSEWECFNADAGEDLAALIREYYVPGFASWKDPKSFEGAFAKLIKDLRVSAT